MELMKNCSKWNSRTSTERKTRFRYPFYDQQTGTAQRPVSNYYKKKEQRYKSNDPNTVIQYSAARWVKSGQSSADSLEMKMFLRENPALDAAVNQSTSVPATSDQFLAEVAAEPVTLKGTPKQQQQHVFEDFVDELDEDISPGSVSDEDDWGSKKKRKGPAGGSGKKKKNAGRNTKASRA